MADRDGNKKVLLDLAKQPHNNRCADCGAPEPDWASYKLGIFVCLNCSGTHRNLPAISRIKSIRLDYWNDDLVEFMKVNGNAAAKAIYERAIPAFYYRPQEHDCVVLRDQWIRAKYERQEFTGENSCLQQAYCSGFYEGTLWKKGKDNKQFLKRKFILSEKDFTLKYFTRDDASKGPKAVIAVKDLNAVFHPEKIGHLHGLQITYLQDEHTRNLFVYHDSGQEIVTWFNAIRAVRLSYLKTAFPTATANEDAVELGTVFIGTESLGYSVRESQPRGARGNKWRCGVTLETPDRQFVFMCENELSQREWVEAFRVVMAQPMTPQHYNTEANMNRRK
ncbi:arf-GAP with dual PH domain-containing protein 2-like isoform X2 [Conger conger]|uniref:arf-GAP with dual PH domain-containing protein 2-like isoform X2 n=1 Tax=Conger conger TaxID=82655 RepID=UPI002A59856B|nr:arf-GAP with dual PH domain-containing protein 2-like isoform X2 [Conger conger]